MLSFAELRSYSANCEQVYYLHHMELHNPHQPLLLLSLSLSTKVEVGIAFHVRNLVLYFCRKANISSERACSFRKLLFLLQFLEMAYFSRLTLWLRNLSACLFISEEAQRAQVTCEQKWFWHNHFKLCCSRKGAGLGVGLMIVFERDKWQYRQKF